MRCKISQLSKHKLLVTGRLHLLIEFKKDKYHSVAVNYLDKINRLLIQRIWSSLIGHGRILAVDQRDFNTYRCKQTKPFENLLFC